MIVGKTRDIVEAKESYGKTYPGCWPCPCGLVATAFSRERAVKPALEI